MARSEFAEFLIARRARLQPRDVGLPAGRRRRTPGLRREEVAALAGVSVDYLARLEQGRDTNPSTAVLGALADALRLNEVERHHFAKLALGGEHGGGCPSTGGRAPEQVPETLRAVLDALHPTPAFVAGRWLNVLACNAAWRDFVEPLGVFDDEVDANLARYFFAHPAAQRWSDWAAAADMVTSRLRVARSIWPDDDDLGAMVAALQRYPEFACRWSEHRMNDFRSGTLRLDHPLRGRVEVEFETLDPAADQSVQIWFVDRRRSHAPSLRLVNE
ncbi:helix-turn-helix transcriptional regulator [Nocardia sp. CDC159]|uniref:Helix-turn-helix transcriptional regulator n=1 Tax=Nocardia pulmonis TaxID=2951408 RepID=A0A9X2IZ35_9NOCA|nr:MULTISPECIES: helix-turn-helix transcriptional regulator [Nocardia]MCM6776334.1 helix-turn-helix transcriptional regulator [Nocardia pulmonis]MCM6788758.1 helix-turn-helix transcriptional regulator [Nocardia sp. CDC159]